MTIFAVDPRQDKLELLVDRIRANHPGADIRPFRDSMPAYKDGAGNAVDSVNTVININRLTSFEL